MLIRITIEEWINSLRKQQTKSPPLFLCELPYSVKEMEDLYNLEFEPFEEDGLGVCFSDTVKINDLPFLFFGSNTKESKDIGVYAKTIAQDKDALFCLKTLCDELKINKTDLLWINNNCSPGS